VLDGLSFLFHGMIVQDMAGVCAEGFRTRVGKCSFAMDADYVLRKYATLGRNSRHRYGPDYWSDVELRAAELGIAEGDARERLVRESWARSDEHTALLILSTDGYALRPGLGNRLYGVDSTLIGGLSKWLHFHLALIPSARLDWWDQHEEQLQRAFVDLQDARYGRMHGRQIGPAAAPELRQETRMPLCIPADRIVGFLKATPRLRETLSNVRHTGDRDASEQLQSLLADEMSWLQRGRSGDGFRRLADDIIRGIRWGQRVYMLRRLFLEVARQRGVRLIKVDAPSDTWRPEEVVTRMRHQDIDALAPPSSATEGALAEYTRACLISLNIGSIA
jgi:hypothetical protein